jgi:hypothetical protein
MKRTMLLLIFAIAAGSPVAGSGHALAASKHAAGTHNCKGMTGHAHANRHGK